VKILAIQFKYLGDAVLMTPALRAIRDYFPRCVLHVLVAEEVAPILQFVPWLDRVWAFPRKRGRANLRQTWPLIRSLRREHFDRSVDFVGNDRGAMVSLLCGARQRLGQFGRGGFIGRRFCYNQSLQAVESEHPSLAALRLLSVWGIALPEQPRMEIRANPGRARVAEEIFPRPAILCHLGTSQHRTQWPVARWAEFYSLATAAGYELVFSTGPRPQEQALLEELKTRVPGAPCLPIVADLATFVAVLRRARVVVSGDTGPLHCAAGLGVPTVAMFGYSSASRWTPFARQYRTLQGGACSCEGRSAVCLSPSPCMAAISPEAVMEAVSRSLRQHGDALV
jgi:lipopolysaccharide heptosyltransferase III